MSVTDTLTVSLWMGRMIWDRTLLPNKWQTPRERIHEVGEPIWIGGVMKLSNVKDVILVLEDGRLVVMVKVVRAREEGHDGWEAFYPRLSVHPITIITARVSVCEKGRHLQL